MMDSIFGVIFSLVVLGLFLSLFGPWVLEMFLDFFRALVEFVRAVREEFKR